MTTKEQVQEWTREEWTRLEREKRDACDHARSGTMRDSLLYCDDCGKQLNYDDQYRDDKPEAELSSIEQRHVAGARRRK